jgi:acetyl-CoA C-acetyltransferase
MKIAVLGAYQTKFGELWDKSLSDLISEAVFGAIRDSGLPQESLQIGFIGNMLSAITPGQNHLGALLSEITGLSIPFIRVEAACSSGGVALAQACQAIESGNYEVALVVGAEKMTDLSSEDVSQALMGAASLEERDAGLSFPGLYALMATAYMKEFGAKEEDLALVSVKNHFHASLNPKAQFPFEITLKDVLQSTLVSSPLKLLDCSPISDGAAAVILSSEPFAQKVKKDPVYIVGSAQASDSLSLSNRKSLIELSATQKAADKAFLQAGLERDEIDLLEVHDCFTIAEILAIEDLGFYAKGSGFEAVRKSETKLGGKLPVNLSGGLKACGHPVGATGIKQVVEVYSQLNNLAGKRQVKGVKAGLTHNVGGTGGTAVVHILRK